jgi:osmotically-inducible protein OsmY
LGSSALWRSRSASRRADTSKVTLRGPVKSEQERSAIESRAKQTPGVTEVNNQLELKK